MEKKLVIGLGGAFILLLTVYAIMTSDNRIFNEENSLDHKGNNNNINPSSYSHNNNNNNNPDDKINNNINNNNEHSHSPVNNNNNNNMNNMNMNNNPPVNNNNINNNNNVNNNPFNQQQQQGGNFKPQQQQQQKPLNNNNNNNLNNGQQQKPAANQKGGFIIPQNNGEEVDRFELYSTPQIPLLGSIFTDQDQLSSLTDLSIQLAQLQSQNRKSFFQEMLKSGDPSSFMKEHNNNFNVEGERTGRYWNGLPISAGNYLFVDPFSTPNFNLTKDRFFDEISELSIENFANPDITSPIYDRFYRLIGINGIMDVLVDRNDEIKITSPVIHNLGEYIYRLIEPNDDVEYGLEVTTRGILQNAPLHGFIWETISHKFDQYSDPADIFRFVDDRLCYFKNYSGMAVVYISCVHGVGHGLDGIFGLSTDKSISICERNENNDFKYTCATGVYMSAVPNYPRQYPDPCLLRFPATCFRFKRYSPCSQFSSSRYHEMGCVWGQSYMATSKKPFYVSYFCSQLLPSNILSLLNPSSPSSSSTGQFSSLEEWEGSYEYDRYVACVDGYLSNAAMWSVPENMANATCASLIGRRAQDTCLKSKVHVMDYDIDDGVQWDYPLLEKYFDPDQPPFPLRHPTDDEIAALQHVQANNPTQGEGEHHHG